MSQAASRERHNVVTVSSAITTCAYKVFVHDTKLTASDPSDASKDARQEGAPVHHRI